MKKFILAALVLAPSLAFAQQFSNIEVLIKSVGRLVNLALPIVVGLALLAFFWGLFLFIIGQADETKKKEAKKVMIWSVVALFVMVSVWGLVRFIGDAFGIEQRATPNTVPTVPGL